MESTLLPGKSESKEKEGKCNHFDDALNAPSILHYPIHTCVIPLIGLVFLDHNACQVKIGVYTFSQTSLFPPRSAPEVCQCGGGRVMSWLCTTSTTAICARLLLLLQWHFSL